MLKVFDKKNNTKKSRLGKCVPFCDTLIVQWVTDCNGCMTGYLMIFFS